MVVSEKEEGIIGLLLGDFVYQRQPRSKKNQGWMGLHPHHSNYPRGEMGQVCGDSRRSMRNYEHLTDSQMPITNMVVIYY